MGPISVLAISLPILAMLKLVERRMKRFTLEVHARNKMLDGLNQFDRILWIECWPQFC